MVKSAKSEYPEVIPAICVDHDRENYHIEIELPGVQKEKIDLEMGEESFCVRAPKEDLVYAACYTLAHHIDTEHVDARFDNGLLTIKAPLKNPITVGVKIPIK
ncbi:molecular chaperone (small heat shock protein) [Candidatus Methanoperedens nitroreducens]|uniref:Molecular chaperone (Small heat shock protein) n=1 Tax=Candidatus Methanoperedens nitratireducens TaxID=1392998 RepID=A0A062VD96_9EURY|nr:Hsp20 family protein [Candidatus Methanoperedens nitroreducens]KCZ73225.1 molecular chaperone (small heat shock protein) [Candidatus Methanoperedens nitroreducens]MDJ1422827.1 Hsp20 family protein [Candidatus Methanoperedens sp.]